MKPAFGTISSSGLEAKIGESDININKKTNSGKM